MIIGLINESDVLCKELKFLIKLLFKNLLSVYRYLTDKEKDPLKNRDTCCASRR